MTQVLWHQCHEVISLYEVSSQKVFYSLRNMGKKYEKLFFGGEKKTLFGTLEIRFLKISHCSRF